MLQGKVKAYFKAWLNLILAAINAWTKSTMKQRRIARLVRSGITPQGIPTDEIFEALKITRGNATEMFGFLSAKVFDPQGNLKQDLGLQSVQEITAVFSKLLVDGMMDSAVSADLDHFNFHAMGSGSTAETDTETALVTEKAVKQAGSQTHGATSEIYRSVKTMTATSSFGVREHGIFNTLTGGTLLDRSLVTAIDLNTDDEVAWTYELTVNAGG